MNVEIVSCRRKKRRLNGFFKLEPKKFKNFQACKLELLILAILNQFPVFGLLLNFRPIFCD